MERDLSNISITIEDPPFFDGSYSKLKLGIIDGKELVIKISTHKDYFSNELKVLLALNDCENTPTLRYFDKFNKILAMDYAGLSLPYYVKQNPDFNLINYEEELCNIIWTLHYRLWYYHNDLKPKNVCIDKNGKLTLIDFEKSSRHEREYKYIFRDPSHINWSDYYRPDENDENHKKIIEMCTEKYKIIKRKI
tara:strand:+ start:5999 stop:6577 length:579 start_codon:yes stop_codon:yes gene_type:complete